MPASTDGPAGGDPPGRVASAGAATPDAWLARLPLVDHHCHGVVESTLQRAGFEDLITESDRPAPPGCTFFDTQLGMAIRAQCAPLLGLPAYAAPEDYLARRAELGAPEVNRRLLSSTGISDYLVETGYRGDAVLRPAALAAHSGAGHAQIVRLERIAETLADAGVAPDDYPRAFRTALDDRLQHAVGVKTIAAYRGGFGFDPSRPTDQQVVRSARAWIDTDGSRVSRSTEARLSDPVLIRFGIWEAVERTVPIQVHVGYGDPDIDLDRCNPLLLTELLRRSRGSGAAFMLLHCYPYHREAGYLAHVFEHVYIDVGLAVNYTGAQSGQIIAESLELTPFHKALFSSDAFGAAELFSLGALLFRRGLGQALGRWEREHGWPPAEQRRIAGLIASGNARRVYRLDDVPTTSFGSRPEALRR